MNRRKILKEKGSELQTEVCGRHAEMCKVFTHPIRLRILDILREREISVSDLAERLGVAIGNLSQHLNMMKQRRVLVSRKDGNNVFYQLANPKMLKAFDLMREILLEQMQQESVLVRHMQRSRARQ